MNLKYTLRLYTNDYTKVDNELRKIEVSRKFEFRDFDDIMNLIGYMTHGTEESIKFELRTEKEDQ